MSYDGADDAYRSIIECLREKEKTMALSATRTPVPSKGRIVAYYAEQSSGVHDYTPAIVTRVVDNDETVNLRLFSDDNAFRRCIMVRRKGKAPSSVNADGGFWDWMPMVGGG